MLGFRLRLLVVLFCAVVSVFGVSFYSTTKIRREAAQEVRQNATRLAGLLAASEEHFFEQAYQSLLTISQVPEVFSKETDSCRKAMARFLEPLYANLAAIDANGGLICSLIPIHPSINHVHQPYFRQPLETGDFVIAGLQPESATGKPILNVAYPVDVRGKLRGVVFASLNLVWLQQVAVSRLPSGVNYNLIDGQGNVLIGHPGSEKAILKRKSAIQEILAERNGGILEISDQAADERLFAFAPIRSSVKGQKLFIGLDMPGKATGRTNHGSSANFAGLFVAVALITTATWASGDLLMLRGVRSLLTVTKKLASGELAARAQASFGGGEVGQWARALGDLAESLRRREVEAKVTAEKMRDQGARQDALHEINLAITSTLDLTAVLTALLEKIDLLLPYSAATVRLYDQESGRLEPIASRNVNEKDWKENQPKAGLGLPQLVFDTKAPLRVENAQSDPRTMDPLFFRTHGFVSYVGVPLMVKGERLGVLSFYTKKEHRFSPEEVDFLMILAGQAAIAIHNSQLFVQVSKQAVELEKSNKLKNEFLAVMSHELRTPLNIIMNYTEMFKAGTFGEVSQSQSKALAKVSHQSGELLRMINGILEVARLEAGTVGLQGRILALADLIYGLKSEYSAPIEKDVQLIWNIDANFPPVETDDVKLKQVLNHLIDNAIKFTDEGTVTISVRSLNHEQAVEFIVSDTGVGIAEDSLPFIFEKFRQIDSSNSRSYGGTGLGLYIARTYTEMLQGTMTVKSEPGQGSTFTVRLPFQPARA